MNVRGPLDKGRYVIANRKFTGAYAVDFGGKNRKPRVEVSIGWQPNAIEWKMALNNKRLERARAASPMLK